MTVMSEQERRALNARVGAYSFVTDREATGDRSVTLDLDEKSVLFQFYDSTSFARMGGAMPNGNPLVQRFIVHGRNDLHTWTVRDLPIRYPKRSGNELRLYMSAGSEFEGYTDDVFCMFAKPGDVFPRVMFCSQLVWQEFRNMSVVQSRALYQTSLQDEDDELFQRAIAVAGTPGIAPSARVPVTSMRYQRNPSVALTAITEGNYQCEVDPTHSSFIAAASGRPYVEAHHLVPMSAQAHFSEANLDVAANIVPLCPNCHRRVHFEQAETRIDILRTLWNSRRRVLSESGIHVEFGDLLRVYNLA